MKERDPAACLPWPLQDTSLMAAEPLGLHAERGMVAGLERGLQDPVGRWMLNCGGRWRGSCPAQSCPLRVVKPLEAQFKKHSPCPAACDALNDAEDENKGTPPPPAFGRGEVAVAGGQGTASALAGYHHHALLGP